jgi:hypothetical protein
MPVAAKLVRVRFLDPVYRGDVMTVGLRWEATGPAGSLFPVLDTDIAISPGGQEGTPAVEESARLALTGAYRPPLGRLGQGSTGLCCTGSRQRRCAGCWVVLPRRSPIPPPPGVPRK